MVTDTQAAFYTPSKAPLRHTPGPPAYRGLWSLGRFRADPPRYLQALAREYGDVVFFRLGPMPTLLINDPDLIEELLVQRHDEMIKDRFIRDLSDLVGNGILTSEGSFWRRQRKMMAPPLRRKQIAAYADDMVRLTHQLLDGASGDPVRPIHRDMMQLTLEIVVKTLFNVEMSDQVSEIGEAMDIAQEHFRKTGQSIWGALPRWVPRPGQKSFDAAVGRLDGIIYDFIRQRRANPEPGDDLLYRLMKARDDQDEKMSEQQLRDEAVTMFAAGHETTALALTYALHTIGRRPDVLVRMQEELDTSLGSRAATADDFEALPYTQAVVKETLRLYPPAWTIGREPVEDMVVGGYRIPKGTQVLTSQWVTHRDPRWWSEPETFRPERWMEADKARPRFAYYPFGGGPRICIGNHFALMEATLILATVLQQRIPVLVSPGALSFSAAVTLRPKEEVLMQLVPRRVA